MATMTISLSDKNLSKLKEKAAQIGILPEQLVLASIEELLGSPDETFIQAMDYVLKKNAELYHRLA